MHLPLVAVTPSIRLGRITLADRNRFEKRFHYANQPVRYRNRFLCDAALGWRDRWHAFAESEAIWDLTDAIWSQNQLEAGGGLRLEPGLMLDLDYLRGNAAGGTVPVNVLGTNLRISLTLALPSH